MTPIVTSPFAGLPRNHFAVLLADPPWHFRVYNDATGSSRAASNHYRTMDLAELRSLPVANLAARDAVLYLWTTAPHLQNAFPVLAAWGFAYSSNLVWTKDRVGTGYWARSQHEHLLIGKRGNFRAPKPADRPPSVIQAPRREHSRKPDEVYSIIERAFPTAPKIELFARHARPGWIAWGDEAPSNNRNAVPNWTKLPPSINTAGALGVFDGVERSGTIIRRDGEFYAYDADGICIGTFDSLIEAARKIPRNRREAAS
jgi:N6-adenosine-specific RNA methylase IME4